MKANPVRRTVKQIAAAPEAAARERSEPVRRCASAAAKKQRLTLINSNSVMMEK